MKDPFCGYLLAVGMAIAVGIGAMMMTIPHAVKTHVHHLNRKGTSHVGEKQGAHALHETEDDDLTRLVNWARETHFPQLRG